MKKIETISLIGAGRVATHLAKILAQSFQLKQILSRNFSSSQTLAQKLHAQAIIDFEVLEEVDLLIIAVSDSQIQSVAKQLAICHYTGLVAHTSGSTHIDVLRQQGLTAGVFYPLQTFSFEHEVDWFVTPLFIEADSVKQQAQLMDVAQVLSSRCYAYDSEQRLSLHLAAVFACNFSNHCYDIAQQILQQKQVDFNLLMPLIESTTQKLHQTSAYQNQTGPARRQDQPILNMHENMLQENPQWQAIYHLMSESILKRFQSE